MSIFGLHAPIPCELEAIRPLGDFVLVERIEDENARACKSILRLARSGEWVEKQDLGPRFGRVLAVGSGDRFVWSKRDPGKALKLRNADGSPAPMQCQPGDEVIYQRAEANVVNLNGREYCFLHEEQHVLAVIESESAAA